MYLRILLVPFLEKIRMYRWIIKNIYEIQSKTHPHTVYFIPKKEGNLLLVFSALFFQEN